MRGRWGHATLHRRYGHARRALGVVWRPGEVARTTVKIPADPHPIFPPVNVTVEEVRVSRAKRYKDAFGTWTSFGGGSRIKVGYGGKSYWVDAETLEKP